jgi:ubiquitin C-terminal hydrolase
MYSGLIWFCIYVFLFSFVSSVQEFLIFLLDGLHEDLNRVKSKIYTEIDDDNECSDEALADKYRAHLKIDSIIQDLFGVSYFMIFP